MPKRDRAIYMRDYRRIYVALARKHAYRKGVEAMRTAAIALFTDVGEGVLSGETVAKMLQVCDPERAGVWSQRSDGVGD